MTRQVDLPNVAMSAFGSETRRAEVKQIIEEGEVDLGGTVQRYQIARVELLEGEYQGIVMEMITANARCYRAQSIWSRAIPSL